LPGDVVSAVRLALEEVLTNVIRYGFRDGCSQAVRVHLARDANGVTARVEDDGCPFNPLAHPPPAVDRPIEARPIGGLGVWLTRWAMDALDYRREGGKNILVMRKALPPTSANFPRPPRPGRIPKGPDP